MRPQLKLLATPATQPGPPLPPTQAHLLPNEGALERLPVGWLFTQPHHTPRGRGLMPDARGPSSPRERESVARETGFSVCWLALHFQLSSVTKHCADFHTILLCFLQLFLLEASLIYFHSLLLVLASSYKLSSSSWVSDDLNRFSVNSHGSRNTC